MKISVFLAVVAGVATTVLSARPAEAGTVYATTTSLNGGIINPPAAYKITGLQVGGSSYTVDFDHGEFNTVFPNSAPQYFGPFADQIGEEIVRVLNNPSALFVNNMASNPVFAIKNIIDKINDPNTNVVQIFHIPVSASGVNSGEHYLSVCNTHGSWNTACNQESRNPNGPLMYAKFTPEGGTASIPTPALLPGLIGMGAAILRKRQQATSEG